MHGMRDAKEPPSPRGFSPHPVQGIPATPGGAEHEEELSHEGSGQEDTAEEGSGNPKERKGSSVGGRSEAAAREARAAKALRFAGIPLEHTI